MMTNEIAFIFLFSILPKVILYIDPPARCDFPLVVNNVMHVIVTTKLLRCISRQLWWGHRIPVWYIGDADEAYVVARNEDEARCKAVEAGHPPDVALRQEDDVLDTWFSSGLWPFATVGWPRDEDNGDETSDLARFYPGTCLETGYDILFFWVARMVMLGIELTGVSPFKVIYLHGLVRASDGSKMSKTKGNVIDPLDTVYQYGADSLRYSLVTGVTPGQDIPLNMDKIAANKAFANKLWNICKFVTDNALKGVDAEEMQALAVTGPLGREEFERLALPERYIVSKCHELVESVTNDIEKYQLGAAGSKVIRSWESIFSVNFGYLSIAHAFFLCENRFMSFCGTSMLTGTSKYRRPVSTKASAAAETMPKPQGECSSTSSTRACAYCIRTCRS